MTNKFIEQRVEVLENELSEMKLIVEKIRKHYTFVHEPLGAATSSVEDIIEFEGSQFEKSPNQLRGEIIEKVKEFVEDLTKHISQWNYKNETEYGVIDSKVGRLVFNTDFVVNNEKLTIVALLRGSGSGSVYSRGIAKCMPGDVFNEHIGKAIALGRALRLDVSEFEQAVQPKFAFGQEVHYESEFDPMFSCTRTIEGFTPAGYPLIKEYEGYMDYRKLIIINDTNTIYGGVE